MPKWWFCVCDSGEPIPFLKNVNNRKITLIEVHTLLVRLIYLSLSLCRVCIPINSKCQWWEKHPVHDINNKPNKWTEKVTLSPATWQMSLSPLQRLAAHLRYQQSSTCKDGKQWENAFYYIKRWLSSSTVPCLLPPSPLPPPLHRLCLAFFSKKVLVSYKSKCD